MNCTHTRNFVSKEGNICLFFGLFACKHTHTQKRTHIFVISFSSLYSPLKHEISILNMYDDDMDNNVVLTRAACRHTERDEKKRNSIVLRAFAQTHMHTHSNSSNAKTILIRTVRCIVRRNAHYVALCPSLHAAGMRAYFCILLATFATICLLFCDTCRFWSFFLKKKKKQKVSIVQGMINFSDI